MADGLARATGEVGVVLVTSGPGATNAITGIATAYMDSIPLVVLSGQVATSLIGYDAFQECDMVGISRPVVKHSFLVKQTEDIPQVLKKAFWLAASGRPGPVVVDLPKDILNPANKLPYVWPESVSMRSYNPTTTGHKGQIKRALQTLVAAKKPVVYVGGGAITAGCHQQLKETVEALNLPVVSSLMGLGAFPATHRQALGMLGMHGTYEANMTMHNADVIFAVGVRFDDRTTNNLAKYCPNATVLHIDIDPTSISKTVTADIPIVGDARQVLEQMLELLSQESAHQPLDEIRDWWQQIEQWRARQCLKYDTHSEKIKPRGGDRDSLAVDEGRRLRDVRCRAAPDVCCTLLSIRQTASLDQFRWPRHDGFWFTCGTGRQNGVARRNRGLRHWRRQYSDEHPGTVYRVAIRVAGTGGESQ